MLELDETLSKYLALQKKLVELIRKQTIEEHVSPPLTAYKITDKHDISVMDDYSFCTSYYLQNTENNCMINMGYYRIWYYPEIRVACESYKHPYCMKHELWLQHDPYKADLVHRLILEENKILEGLEQLAELVCEYSRSTAFRYIEDYLSEYNLSTELLEFGIDGTISSIRNGVMSIVYPSGEVKRIKVKVVW